MDRTENEDSKGRTLFVANIFGESREAAESELRNLFGSFGGIKNVELDNEYSSSNMGVRSARIEFHDALSVQNILSADKSLNEMQQQNLEVSRKLSLSKILAAFGAKKPDQEQLKLDTDAAMAQFEDKEMAEASRRANLRDGGTDEDGFIEVVYKRKQRDGAGNDFGDGKRRKKKQPLELKNFYRHQIREAKQEQLKKLRARFEDDKARIEKMKRIRKFRPV